MPWLYLTSLLFVILCLFILDRKYKLAFFYDARRSALTLAITTWLFSVWDLFGIRLGIFSRGDSPYMLPFSIVPEFPVEELFFLFVLSYTALLIYRFVKTRRAE
ncbi:MAG: lycopene cyclase domain-containing protein [Candidatus Microsaccharimonas sossegonensis]|uniref:Lycopene cyclase domain-containing protein n=1 Tax=Candidatus Microsaccharimonas sossegonensis TaxID=2506948 RepID=A0A4Q0AJ30_9BACT|nr:MAG: lycopene cyclase domain-containing protein [Candidatus Microsaccharimonas sossegonensis]